MAIVETVTTKYVLDTTQLTRASKIAQNSVKKSSSSILSNLKKVGIGFAAMGVAAAAAAAIMVGKFVTGNLAVIDSLAKQSRALNITIDELQSFQLMAELAGSSGEAVSKSIQKMTIQINKARDGTGEAAKQLEAMGLANEEFFNANPTDQFLQLADKIANMNDVGRQGAVIMDVFQDRSGSLVEVLKGGSKAFKQASDDIVRLGKSISAVDAKKVEDANDAMLRASEAMEGALQKITIALAPLLVQMADGFVDLLNWFSKINNELRDFLGLVDEQPLSGFTDSAPNATDSIKKLTEQVEGVTKVIVEMQKKLDIMGTKGLDTTSMEINLANTKTTLNELTDKLIALENSKPLNISINTQVTGKEGGGSGGGTKPDLDISAIQDRFKSQEELLMQSLVNQRAQVEEFYAQDNLNASDALVDKNLTLMDLEAEHTQALVDLKNNENAEILAGKEKLTADEIALAQAKSDDLRNFAANSLQIAKVFGGKAFKIAKGFALAAASVSAGEAIAKAATALPFPLNIPSVLGATAQGVGAIARIQAVQARQTGGGVNPHSNVLVGENGPELIQFGARGGFVNNAESTQRLLNTNETNTTNLTTQVNFNINAIDAQGVQEFITNSREVIIDMITEAQDEFVGT